MMWRKALLAVACLFWGSAQAVAADADVPGPIAVAPAFELKTAEGATVRYPADAKGRPTVLMFWPSWCPFSRALQPYVQDIWTDYRDRGVALWTINIKEDGDPLKAMHERGLDFPLLLEGDAVANDYRVSRTPWLVVMDGERNILYTRPANPPTPIDVAKRVREVLNGLVGPDKAVPMPTTWAPPYDLHLKKKEDMVDRRQPVAIPDAEAQAWVARYLESIPADEKRSDLPAQGAVQKGREAIALAKRLWVQAYGQERVDEQAPYRAYRRNDRWVVLGQGLDNKLGEGLILVVDAGTGQVVRMVRP